MTRTRYEDVCPHCGSHLVLKEGEHGEFFACPRFPQCRYTKPIKGGVEYKDYIPNSYPYCDKCNHTGILPFLKDGRVIPHASIDCECKNLFRDGEYRPPSPTDYDYPMSDTFRAASYQHTNQPDPGYIAPEPQAPPPQEIIHRHSDMSKQEYALLRNLEGQVKYLQGKLVKGQVRKQTKPSGYKGIK